MNVSCVYIHRKKSNNEPFYVGKGSVRRAKTRSERSVWWHRVANKYGFYVEIVKSHMCEEEAFALEIELIRKYGRRDKGTGTLVNMTDGGEGSSGYRHTEEAKEKISEAARNVSEESRRAGAISRTGLKNSEEVKERKSLAAIGNTKGRMARPKDGSFKGVSFNKSCNKWMAKITVDYKQIYLGIFLDPVDAAIAYDAAAYMAWGDSCWLNFPENYKKIERDY